MRPEFIYLDENVLSHVLSQLREKSTPANDRLARYLQEYDNPYPSIPTLQIIGSVLRDANAKGLHSFTTDASPDPNRPPTPRSTTFVRWGTQFLNAVLVDIRDAICGKGKNVKPLGPKSQGVIAAIAAAIMHKFGIDAATATGLAVLVLIKLGQILKKRFCQMTDAEVLAEFKNAA
jgi:hypothetical protein